jgi:penicillin-binding protein 2
MLIFDQLKKNDPQLRIIAVLLLCGLGVLVAGLWWVQIVSSREYQAHLEMQSFRTVRIPAVRGKIVDRNGVALAENRPTYNINLYLDELRKPFKSAGDREVSRARAVLKHQAEEKQRQLGRKLKKEERKQFVLLLRDQNALRQRARYEVASNVVAEISQRLGQPLTLNPTNFQRHYDQSLALPLPIATNLSPSQIAVFAEQCSEQIGVDLSVQSTRFYPYGTTAAHVLGYLTKDDRSAEGEDAYFSYRLMDYRGVLGIEAGYDKELRGKAGVKSVVVNNLGYRQTENVWEPAQPGQNVVLTIDYELQRKAEKALHIFGANTRGALVVMDVHTGDILALASSPTINPNDSIQGISPEESARRLDPRLRPEINRATFENYSPGSIFKTVTGLACLEDGLDPNDIVNNPGYYQFSNRKSKPVGDLAAPGPYDFYRAIVKSSNTYFIDKGLKTGIEKIVQMAKRLHLGEGTGLQTRQDNPGKFPTLERVKSNWHDGDTANICIGQGAMSVTPLQMAVMISAYANGGTVLWPRLVDRIEPVDPASSAQPTVLEKGRVRDHLGVQRRSLEILRDAMRRDVLDGTGANAEVTGMPAAGKTGTAQVMDAHNHTTANTVWFASFAPFDNPRYAVIVMVEIEVNAGSGGRTCAPIAHEIYQALLERERGGTNHVERVAQAH